MKRIFILLISILLSLPGRSDEGMWLLPKIKNLNMPEMKSMGLTLSASDIYSVNESSLKDAVVIFGGFCTGEIISPKGLLLTNHHCGFDFIQQISTVEKDYLKTGYWAASEEDEIPCEGLTATFLVSMKEITEDVLKNTDTIRDEGKRNAVIEANKEELIQEATQDTHLIGRIKSFFEGNQYF
ncbi:MAG: S46 family peptidase, partial [Bacteroidota bacterium]